MIISDDSDSEEGRRREERLIIPLEYGLRQVQTARYDIKMFFSSLFVMGMAAMAVMVPSFGAGDNRHTNYLPEPLRLPLACLLFAGFIYFNVQSIAKAKAVSRYYTECGVPSLQLGASGIHCPLLLLEPPRQQALMREGKNGLFITWQDIAFWEIDTGRYSSLPEWWSLRLAGANAGKVMGMHAAFLGTDQQTVIDFAGNYLRPDQFSPFSGPRQNRVPRRTVRLLWIYGLLTAGVFIRIVIRSLYAGG